MTHLSLTRLLSPASGRTMLLVAGLAATIAGCNVGPDQRTLEVSRGTLESPTGWSSDASAAGLSTERASVADWWTVLGDEQLSGLITRAVTSNLDIESARVRIAEARALRGIVAADGLPQVDATGDYRRFRTSEETGEPVGSALESRDNWQAGFDASWELDLFGRTRRGVEAAEADIAAAEEGLRDAMVTLTAEVGRNYVELRSFQERLAITNRNIQLQSDAVSLARSRFDAGLTSELDVAQARTLLASSRASVPPLEAAVAVSTHRLGVLLGLDPAALKADLAAAKPVPLAKGEGGFAAAPIGRSAEMLMRRPDLRAAERRVAAATSRIGVGKADLYPRVSLLGSLSFSAANFADTFDMNARNWSIGPSIRWNVFDGGRIRANISTLEQREKLALLEYQKSVLGALEEAESAIINYAKNKERRERLVQAVESSRTTVQLSEIQYKAGKVAFLNVIEAQRAQLALEDNLAEADRDVTTSLITVYKAVGGGWEKFAPLPEAKAQAKTTTTP
jgi:NodT family efflux transporter outer membrane factor (OMF) lipoprotein